MVINHLLTGMILQVEKTHIKKAMEWKAIWKGSHNLSETLGDETDHHGCISQGSGWDLQSPV